MLRAAPASMSPSQRTALAQHAGRLHRLHDAKREVIIYDYVDMSVPVLARMAAKRRVGYQAIGYRFLGAGDLFSDQSVASEASPQRVFFPTPLRQALDFKNCPTSSEPTI